jgi:uncharacterized membrane protein YeaQ/YmgE (transglycosylase-associated protein family)
MEFLDRLTVPVDGGTTDTPTGGRAGFDAGVYSSTRQGYCSATTHRLEADMTITGIITAILVGAIIGVLGRLVVPGRQNIGVLVTVLVGIVAAFVGTALARVLGIPTATSGIDWMELIVQVIVAALGVALVAAVMGRKRGGLLRR